MGIINTILDINITLGVISLCANLYVLAIFIFGDPYKDDDDEE